jgi:hypothetical protein
VASLGLIVVRSSRTATAATSPLHRNFPAQNVVLRWFVFKGFANASRVRSIEAYGAIDCSRPVPGRDMLARGPAASSRTIPRRAFARAAHKTARS